MARIRTVKPEFFKHYDLWLAEFETHLPLRIAFSGLWCIADREGRFKWRPHQIKIEVLPYDEVDFSRVLDALTTRGFIRFYRVGHEEYGDIPTFGRHQVINNRERPSEIPEYNDNNDFDASSTRATRVNGACTKSLDPALGEGKEGKEEVIGRASGEVSKNSSKRYI